MRISPLLALALVAAACGGGDDDGDSTDGETTDGSPSTTDSGAADSSIPGKRVFITSETYDAALEAIGGGASGVEGADNICNNTAGAIGLPGSWQAWISSTTEDAIDRITGSGPWYRMDGSMAFLNKANLTTSPLVPLTITEKEETLDFPPDLLNAWTGTGAGGRYSDATNDTCSDWTSILGDGTVGDAGELDGGWTDFDLLDCDLAGRLYCFEQ